MTNYDDREFDEHRDELLLDENIKLNEPPKHKT